jgi:hypothetical protein
MKYKTSIFLLLLCFFILEKIKAQGGRSAGLANSNVTIQDESSVFNNIAGIASQKTLCGILSFENKYTNTAFNTASAAVVIPSKLGVGSFDIKRFGNNLYNENKIGLGFSHQIQSVSIGLKTSYQQYYIQEYGTKGLFLYYPQAFIWGTYL